jgi:uncharacterized membrane protein YhaH (DUF805 family)
MQHLKEGLAEKNIGFLYYFRFCLALGQESWTLLFFRGTKEVFSVIVQLGIIIPSIAVTVRRMHDVDKSGWFCLIPIYGLVLCCTNGTQGQNRFGPDPKA